MRAIRAYYRGRQILLPAQPLPTEPGDVIVVFGEETEADARPDRTTRDKAQEEVFSKVWNNRDGEIYDQLFGNERSNQA